MDDELRLPGDQEGLEDDDVRELLSELGGELGGEEDGDDMGFGEEDDDEAGLPALANEKIVRQEDIDALLEGGLLAAKEALGATADFDMGEGGEAEFQARPATPKGAASIDLLVDVPLKVKVELGRNRMSLDHILKLKKSSIVELDKLAGDPLDVLVNDRLVARGEVLVLNDNFCIRITEIVKPKDKKN